MLILLACFFDTKNFDRFIERINIPSSILAKRLRYLVEVDILERKTQNNDHRRHEYQLSDKGKSFAVNPWYWKLSVKTAEVT